MVPEQIGLDGSTFIRFITQRGDDRTTLMVREVPLQLSTEEFSCLQRQFAYLNLWWVTGRCFNGSMIVVVINPWVYLWARCKLHFMVGNAKSSAHMRVTTPNGKRIYDYSA